MTPEQAASKIISKLPNTTQEEQEVVLSAATALLIIDVLTAIAPIILRNCRSGSGVQQACRRITPYHDGVLAYKIRLAMRKHPNSKASQTEIRKAIFKTGANAHSDEIESFLDNYRQKPGLRPGEVEL